MHALPWHSFPRKPWAASPLGNGLWIRIFFCRFERWTTAVCFSCQTESFVVIAIQTHIAHLVSQHPHNGHISPLLAIYNVASLTPYRCARLLLDYRMSNAPVMLLLGEEISEVLTPFHMLHLWAAACVLLLDQSFSASCPASYFVSHLPPE